MCDELATTCSNHEKSPFNSLNGISNQIWNYLADRSRANTLSEKNNEEFSCKLAECPCVQDMRKREPLSFRIQSILQRWVSSFAIVKLSTPLARLNFISCISE
mmetsp:Transcript_9399/g.34889  ORF Transcript_9399/g.34889 Transcript_9399/m.34889 type:complete len:103 (-) Transcript_9399:3080-3388(-)